MHVLYNIYLYLYKYDGGFTVPVCIVKLMSIYQKGQKTVVWNIIKI